MKSKQNIAKSFLCMVAHGEIAEAYKQFTSKDFIHHNVHMKGDRESLMHAMMENQKLFPDKKLEVKQAIQDENKVMLFSHVQMEPDDPGVALVHIFRFENDQIVELWDLGQAIPPESPNQYGVF